MGFEIKSKLQKIANVKGTSSGIFAPNKVGILFDKNKALIVGMGANFYPAQLKTA